MLESADEDAKTAAFTAFLTDQNVQEAMKKARVELLETKNKEV